MLAVWSAISTPVLALVVVLLVEPGWTVLSIGIETVVLLFAIEALARRQLAWFAVLVATLLVVASIALSVVTALLDDWRVVVSIPLALAALALIVQELRRD